MLQEYTHVRQIQGEPLRRWFANDYFDLIVWYEERQDFQIVGFQLCYDITRHHRAFTWHREKGYAHHRVDDGESRPGKMKASPILIPDGEVENKRIAQLFYHAGRNIDQHIASFIYEKILSYVASTS